MILYVPAGKFVIEYWFVVAPGFADGISIIQFEGFPETHEQFASPPVVVPDQEILYPLQRFPDPLPVVPPLTVISIEPVEALLHRMFDTVV